MAQQREEDENEVSGGEGHRGKRSARKQSVKGGGEQAGGEMMWEQEVGIRRGERKSNGNRKKRTDCGKCKAKRGSERKEDE